MNKANISVGLPVYGGFSDEWTPRVMHLVAKLATTQNVIDIISMGSMTADHNRNGIVADFLKSAAEWLFWIDSDTIPPIGSVDRLLRHGRTLVSGLYYGKHDPHPPIAYTIYNGAFTPINKTIMWEKGEIIPVDAVGMGCMLTHRSVFEDILKNYEVFQIPGGGVVPVHKNDLLGEVKDDDRHEHDGKVYRGQLRTRVRRPSLEGLKFPFFMVEHLRTEDMFFFDLARRVGHTPVLDSSVECEHLRWKGFKGEDFRNIYGH